MKGITTSIVSDSLTYPPDYASINGVERVDTYRNDWTPVRYYVTPYTSISNVYPLPPLF